MNTTLPCVAGPRAKTDRRPSLQRQRGVVLFISLIMLVAMTMAAIALVRSVDTAVMVAGNLAFRQGATTSGHAGIEAARAWLLANATLLKNDKAGDAYYSSSQNNLDLTGNATPGITSDDVAWGGGPGASQSKCLAKDGAGNTVCYIIHRLCDTPNSDLNSSTCATKETTLGGSSVGAARQMLTYQEGKWQAAATQAYYRITVRIVGPRNNISYTQAFVVI